MSAPRSGGPSSSAPAPQSNAQILSTNRTVDALLGGRTKSWMQTSGSDGASQPVAPSVKSSNIRGIPSARRRREQPPMPQGDENAPQPPFQNTATDESVLPSPALTNEPSPSASTRHVSPNTTSNEPQTASTEPPVFNHSYFEPAPARTLDEVSPEAISASGRPDSSRRSPTSAGPSEPAGPPLEAEPEAVQPAPRTMTTATASVQSSCPSVLGKRARGSDRADPAASPQPPRPVLPESYAQVVMGRIRTLGGLTNLDSGLVQPRYRYLLEACRQRDDVYVLLHQVFCLWSHEKPFRYERLSPMPRDTVDEAFGRLSYILRSNSAMEEEHLAWFAAFPAPLESGLSPFDILHMADIVSLLKALAHIWPHLLNAVRERSAPAMAWELRYTLSCPSPILRGTLSTFSSRALGVHGKYSLELRKLNAEDEAMEYSVAEGRVNNVASLRQEMFARYKSIVQQAQHDTSPAPRSASPSTDGMVAPVGVSRTRQSSTMQALQPPCPVPSASGHYPSPVPNGNNPNQMATAGQLPQSQAAPSQPRPHPGVYTAFPAGPATSMAPDPTRRLQPANVQGPQVPAQRPMQIQAGHGNAALPRTFPLPHGSWSSEQGPTSQLQGWLEFQPHGSPLARSPAGPVGQFHAQYGAQYSVPTQRGTGLAPRHQPHQLQHPHQPSQPQHPHQPSQPQQPRQPLHPQQTHQSHPPPGTNYFMTPPYSQQDNGYLPFAPPALPSVGLMLLSLLNNNTASAPAAGTPGRTAPEQRDIRHAPINPTGRPDGQQHGVRLIQEHEFPAGPYDHTSVRMSAHLPQLRSPERKPGRGVSGRFYQYVTKCAVQPTRMDPRSGIRTLEFTLPAGAAALLPQKATGITELPIRSYTEGCIRLRLRCSRRPKRETYVRDSDWAISDTTWPGEMYTFFNETAIELPRKQHFRHDRPAELTDLAVEGPNVVKISLPDNKCNLSEDSTFFLAVEVVLTASRSFLENGVRAARHTTAEETKKKIARRLTSTSPDDDVVAADTTLSISLADPFSATMVEVPVRGVDCEHMECFDLGNWLASRPSKKSGGGEPSLADCWKCPICGRDARPHRLHIDDFLVEVRAELLADGKQRTKRIQVAADGSWVPVAEPEDSDDEGDAPPPSGPAQESSRVSSRSVPPAAAVIEILDDD